MSIFIPTIRADFCISESYNYLSRKPLSSPITALESLSDHTFNFHELIEWKEQTTSSFQYHFFIW